VDGVSMLSATVVAGNPVFVDVPLGVEGTVVDSVFETVQGVVRDTSCSLFVDETSKEEGYQVNSPFVSLLHSSPSLPWSTCLVEPVSDVVGTVFELVVRSEVRIPDVVPEDWNADQVVDEVVGWNRVGWGEPLVV